MDIDQRAAPIGHGMLAIVSALFASFTPAEWAALLAGFLNFLLICDWWWKRFWRPFLIRRGYIKVRARRAEEYMAKTDAGDL